MTPAATSSVYGALVQRPVATIMGCLAAVVFGMVSYAQLPLNLMPDLDYPTLTVRTEFAGAAPGEVETQLSRPLEETLSTVPGLVQIESISRAGLSDIVLEFEWASDMNEVSQAVRERIGLVDLPDEVTRPLVLRYDPNLDPILRLSLVAPDDSVESLMEARRQADEEVRRALETLPGVAAVKVRGGLERELRVEVDEGLLHARGFTLEQLVQRLQQENVNLAGGSLLEGQTEYLIRTLNEFRGPEEVAGLMVLGEGGRVARVGDLASVSVRPKEREVVGRVGGREAVEVAVYREADANVVATSRAVRDAVFGTEEQRQWVADTPKREKAEKEAKEKAAKEEAERKQQEAEAAAKAGTDGKDGKKAQKDGAKAGKGGKGGKRGKRGGKGNPMGGGGRGGGGEGGGYRDAELERHRMTSFLAHKLPEGFSFSLVSDQARFIEAAIAEVNSAALQGAVLSILVIYLFLRHGWTTFVNSTAIPISVALTFAPMQIFGVSLNVMSLGGIAMAVGMVVDNATVVLESIARCREEGDDAISAAVRGTQEVAGAVTASTLTTIAVFLPIAFVTGIAGQLFGHLSLTVVFGLLASLAVALLLVPVLAALPARLRGEGGGERGPHSGAPARDPLRDIVRFLPPLLELRDGAYGLWRFARQGRVGLLPLRAAVALLGIPLLLLRFGLVAPLLWPAWAFLQILRGLRWLWGATLGRWTGGLGSPFRPIGRLFDRLYEGLDSAYAALVAASLRRPAVVLSLCVALFVGTLLWGGRLGRELLPETHQDTLLARLSLPVGTPLPQTLLRIAPVEKAVRALPEVDTVFTSAGVERDVAAAADQGENTADLLLRLKPAADSARAEQSARDGVRDAVGSVPGLSLALSSPSLFSFRTPIEVEVRGNDIGDLRKSADLAAEAMRRIPGLADVRSNLVSGYPEVQVHYDRERLARYGLDVGSVARAVRDKVQGNVATDLRGHGRRTDVRVILRETDRESLDDLRRLNVNPKGAPPIPLEAVAKLSVAEGPSEIRRADQERAALVTATLSGFDLSAAATAVSSAIAGLDVPPDVRLEVGGQSREMESSMQSLQFALLLAVFLVYVIMASQFESVVQPLIILLSVPMAVVGVVPALWASGTPVSVVVLLGGIVLAGIVVNNAIVLVDYANTLRSRGLTTRDALVTAGRVRLRPILITTGNTVLGLLPMLIQVGEGSEIRRPLALTLMAGLTSSTLLTLVVIPVLYQLVSRESAAAPAQAPALSPAPAPEPEPEPAP